MIRPLLFVAILFGCLGLPTVPADANPTYVFDRKVAHETRWDYAERFGVHLRLRYFIHLPANAEPGFYRIYDSLNGSSGPFLPVSESGKYAETLTSNTTPEITPDPADRIDQVLGSGIYMDPGLPSSPEVERREPTLLRFPAQGRIMVIEQTFKLTDFWISPNDPRGLLKGTLLQNRELQLWRNRGGNDAEMLDAVNFRIEAPLSVYMAPGGDVHRPLHLGSYDIHFRADGQPYHPGTEMVDRSLCPRGKVTSQLKSIATTVHLGSVGPNQEPAYLELKADKPGSPGISPEGLSPSNLKIEEITTAARSQFLSSSAIANVVPVGPTPSDFDILTYAREASTGSDADGLHQLAGDPLVTLRIRLPDPDRLTIERVEGATSHLTTYQWDETTTTLAMEQEVSGVLETLQTIGDPAGEEYEERRIQRDAAAPESTALGDTLTTYRNLPGFGNVATRIIRDPEGVALTWVREFHESGAAIGMPRSESGPGEPWRQYEWDEFRELTKFREQVGDAPADAPDSSCRVVRVTRSADRTVETRVETYLGVETRRIYRRQVEGGFDEFLATETGASIDAASNLVTRYRYAEGDFRERLRLVDLPDGTRTTFNYAYDTGSATLTTISESGAADPDDPTGVLDGIRTTVITNDSGSTIAEQLVDIASGLTVREALALEFDPFDRPTRIQSLAGISQFGYSACCGLESQTDPSGLSTIFTRDGLTRTEKRRGIEITSTVTGGARSIIRTGRDGSAIPLSRWTLNPAGQRLSHRDAADRETTFEESYDGVDGHLIRTTTFPDGGTRIERYAPDGRLQSVEGTASYPRRYEYGADLGGETWIREIKLGDNGEETEWTETRFDPAGRLIRILTPLDEGAGIATTRFGYDDRGRLVSLIDPDGVTLLYAYNERGERVWTAVDVDGDGAISPDGTDRIRLTERSVAIRDGRTIQRLVERIFREEGQELPSDLRTTEITVDGLESWITVAGLFTHTETVLHDDGDRTITVTFPDGSRQTSEIEEGFVVSRDRIDALGNRIFGSRFSYDPHDRHSSTTDVRNGTTVFDWYDTDQLHSVSRPPASPGAPPQVTTYIYDPAGRPDLVTLPDQGQVAFDYYPTGDVRRVTGVRTYAREHTYDSQGRLISLVTNPGTDASQTTTWNHDPFTGRLSDKRLSGNFVERFTYTPAGRLQTRESARGIVTTHTYHSTGDLATTSYDDGLTPSVSFTYDRGGELATAVRDGVTHTYAYGVPGQIESLSVTGGPQDGALIDWQYDDLQRPSGLTAAIGQEGGTVAQSWDYDPNLSRVLHARQGRLESTYSYESDSDLVSGIDHGADDVSRLTESRQYDALDRLTSISHLGNAAADPVSRSFTYHHNEANQRVARQSEDGSTWRFQYDQVGHLTGAGRFEPGGNAVGGSQFSWRYDERGNRTASWAGVVDNHDGLPSMVTDYQPASGGDRNQYISANAPGYTLTTGKANSDATVTINGQSPSLRQGDFFAHAIEVDNSDGPAFAHLEITASHDESSDFTDREALVPPADAAFEYDADGNLLFDGWREFTWDAENRLLSVEFRADRVPANAPAWRVEYAYDFQGRRIQEKAYVRAAPEDDWIIAAERTFLHDGWKVIGEWDAHGQLWQSYLWGLDLSGTSDGAGSAGGLLAVTRHGGPNPSAHFVAHDGNGNVSLLVNADDGSRSASYDYDPYGNLLAMAGPFAASNPYRFSSKRQDAFTGLYDYGYRSYDPSQGRWFSRDPIAELGGLNLYEFVGGDPVNRVDVLGLVGAAEWWWNAVDLGDRAGRKFWGAIGSGVKGLVQTSWELSPPAQISKASQDALLFFISPEAYRNKKRAQRIAFEDTIFTRTRSLQDGFGYIFDTLSRELADPCSDFFTFESLGHNLYENSEAYALGFAEASGHATFFALSEAATVGALGRLNAPAQNARRIAGETVEAVGTKKLLIGRGTPEELQKYAEKLGAEVINNAQLLDDSKALFRHIDSEMRKADQIIQLTDEIPIEAPLTKVRNRGNGQWSRAEYRHIDNNEDKFLDKLRRITRSEVDSL